MNASLQKKREYTFQFRLQGRISRFLANKCSIASRIDCFSESSTNVFGSKLKEQVEDRLKFFETGDIPKKNLDVMMEAVESLKKEESEFQTVNSKKEKKKKKRKAEEEAPEADAEEEEAAEAPPKKKKKKMDVAQEEAVADTPTKEPSSEKKKKKKKKSKSNDDDE